MSRCDFCLHKKTKNSKTIPASQNLCTTCKFNEKKVNNFESTNLIRVYCHCPLGEMCEFFNLETKECEYDKR